MKRLLCLWLEHETFAPGALADLALACDRYSPLVGIHEPDCLLLDITSLGSLFGGEERLVAAVVSEISARGYAVRAAIGETVGVAWALAHFGGTLTQAPVAALRLPAEILLTLHDLGLERIEQLLVLPREALAARFGALLLRQLDRAVGREDELITPVRPPPEFRAEWLLEYPTSDRAVLDMILEQLAQRVGEALRMREQGAVQLTCRLDVADSPPRLLEISLFRPTADARHLIELLQLQSELLELRGGVGRVGLAAVTTARLEHRQRELFAAALENHSEELARLLNRLSSRLGREQVLRPQLTTDAVPERAWRPSAPREVLTGPTIEAKSKAARAKKSSAESPVSTRGFQSPCTRPLLLYDPPVSVAVVALAPDGPPASFSYRQTQHRVAHCLGPERIETAWWRGASVRRDYYRVETESGHWFWLFRDLRQCRWFLQGDFS